MTNGCKTDKVGFLVEFTTGGSYKVLLSHAADLSRRLFAVPCDAETDSPTLNSGIR
jgi:hypothetical protein